MEILIREALESDLAAITQLWNEMMAFYKDAMPLPLVENAFWQKMGFSTFREIKQFDSKNREFLCGRF